MKVIFDDSGFPLADYDEVLSEINVKNLLKRETMPFIELPQTHELIEIKKAAEHLKESSDTLVVVGMGGSSRGAKALHQSVGLENEKLLFLDNLDLNLLSETFRKIDWEKTSFAFISKSGRTLETVTLMNIVLEELKNRGLLKGRVAFVGDKGNPFEDLAKELKAPFLPVPKEIGGRFSVFTSVGLLPAYFAGYNVERFLEGAYDLIDAPLPSFYLAAAKYLHHRLGRKIPVLMPYSSFMTEFTEWYSQLWAESLGKESQGQTPLKAVGTASQHSVLQLFIDGPDDKFYQLLFINKYPLDLRLPEKTSILPFLSNRNVSEIVRAEFEGTIHALKTKGRPIVRFELEELNEYEIGYLLMLYMVAVVVMAKFIGVNPYGQPAVEIGKRRAIELLKEKWDEGGLR